MDRTQKIVIFSIIGLPALCCLGTGLSFIMAGKRAEGDVAEKVTQIRALGWPTEPRDLVKSPPLSPSDNAAPLVREAGKLMDGDREIKAAMRTIGSGRSPKAKPKQVNDAIAALPKAGRVLDLARQIGARRDCDFERDWSQGFRLQFPEFATLKSLCGLLLIEARRQSKAGDPMGALKTIELSQGIARHAGSEPTVISLLVGIGCETLNLNALHKVVAESADSPSVRKEARRIFGALGPLPNFQRAIGGEMVMDRQAILSFKSLQDLRSMAGQDAQDSGGGKMNMTIPSQFIKLTEARFMKEYGEVARTMPKKPQEWEKATEVLTKMSKGIDQDNSATTILLKIIFPIFDQLGPTVGELIARRNVFETELDLLDARTNGSFPAKLPTKPSALDPFGGKALRYARQGKGFILYSIGRDRTDDGGQFSRDVSSRAYDVGIKFGE